MCGHALPAVIDLAAHDDAACRERFAHRWPGFADGGMAAFLLAAGLDPGAPITIPGRLDVRIWTGTRPLTAPDPTRSLEDVAA